MVREAQEAHLSVKKLLTDFHDIFTEIYEIWENFMIF